MKPSARQLPAWARMSLGTVIDSASTNLSQSCCTSSYALAISVYCTLRVAVTINESRRRVRAAQATMGRYSNDPTTAWLAIQPLLSEEREKLSLYIQ